MGNCMPLPSSSRRIRSVPSASFHSRPPDGSTNTSARNRLMGSQGPCKQRRHAAMALDSILGRVTMDLTQHYDLGNELGRGRFGLIRQCTNKLTGESFACKSISKLKLTRMKDVEDVRREIDIMRDLSAHPNVVKLKDVYEDKAYVHLIMELCEGGELFDRIAKRRTYPEKEAALLFKTLVEVVKYCHEMGVIHRDLKPENILLVNSSSSSPIKLADFGLALRFTRGETFSGTAGSAYYIAPEVLNGNYSEEVDVWSAGVILYILLCGTAPFWGETDESIFEAIREGKIDFTSAPMGDISMAAKDLINRMLCPNPKARLMPAEILKHPWILRHTTQPEQDDGRNTRQDSSQEATCWRTKSGEADESVANPGGKENMEEISAARKETCLPKGLSDEQASLTTMATDYLLPECSPDLQATPEFAFQSGAADEAPEALSSPLCEGKAESTFFPYSFTQPASALSISPSSFVSSETSSPDSFDRWASSSLGAGFKVSEFLAAIFSRLDTVHLSPVWGHSQVHEQDKAIVRVDSADQGKIMVLYDRSRGRGGWMVLPSLSDSQACYMGLIPPSLSLHNSHTFYKLVWSSQDAAFVLALPLSYTPHKNLNQALRVDDLPACILSLYKTLRSTQPTDFSSPTFLTARFGSYLAPSNYVQICF